MELSAHGMWLLALAGVLLLVSALNRFAPLSAAAWLEFMGLKLIGLAKRQVVVHGQRLPYLHGGRGPALVLVHGFTASKELFLPLARHLTAHFTVYAVDLPGFGAASREADADYSVAEQERVLHAFVCALGLREFHLGGHSMGGGIAARYAALHPQRVLSLWLLAPGATQEVLDTPMIRRYRESGEFALLIRTPEESRAKIAAVAARPLWLPYCVVHAQGVAAAADYHLHRKILDGLVQEAPLEQLFRDLPTPTLLVFGALDPIVPPQCAPTLARIFPRNETRIMAGVGHLPLLEAPGLTAADYLNFVRRLGSSA